jgi:hypothetical protein
MLAYVVPSDLISPLWLPVLQFSSTLCYYILHIHRRLISNDSAVNILYSGNALHFKTSVTEVQVYFKFLPRYA